jgi:glucose/arabinose dehydrogenase
MPKQLNRFSLTRLADFILIALICTFVAGPVHADDPELEFTIISARINIVDIANAGDGSGRLFLVQRSGRIYIQDGGVALESPFLDIRTLVEAGGIEQGLLSVAFAPNYETSGYFYVWYTGAGGGTVLSRFRVSDDSDIADAGSEQIVLAVDQPFSNHNGGRLQFGPDGMLYLGLGDGGAAFDPQENGQDGSTLLGKVIRIDVNPVHGTYAIPGDNPFVGDGSVRDEIWALGLRNPWRIGFDSKTGDLFIADVGEGALEEVNFQQGKSTGGENYGWSIMEGSQCVGGGNACDESGLSLPVAEYDYDDGDCAIIGGEVYRGTAYPNLVGMYLYADWCTGRIWGLTRIGEVWTSTLLADTSYAITTFGQGEDGNIYLASTSDGVFLISDGDVVPEVFGINPGMNDAWFNTATAGQGMLISVFEDAGVLFVAWFTYDVERPPEDVTAILGEPGHRWLTGQGTFSGDTAILDIFSTAGGVFDSINPVPDKPVKIGTMTIIWTDCNAAVVTYVITDPPLIGEFPIERVVLDNVKWCEAF